MSVDQARRELNQIDKEIVELEKKLADLSLKEADIIRYISDLERSITKSTSASTRESRNKYIQYYKLEHARIAKEKAAISKKIADKRNRRADAFLRLQREEANETQKAIQAQKTIQTVNERRIAELTSQVKEASKPRPISSQPGHLYSEGNDIVYDVFISYATEDKEDFADKLYHILHDEYGISVFYDTISIQWGDSLRAKIDAGLRKSIFGIVVLSRDYIRKGWPQYELDGLFQKEMTHGKTILPIWHNITKEEVQGFSPTLSGRYALSTDKFTPREIADELMKLLCDIKRTEEVHDT